jgi:hypothetical protein
MAHKLKSGDRIRISTEFPKPGFQPGDKGTVLFGPILRGNGQPYYIVTMDTGGCYSSNSIFCVDEIEPDV